MIIGVVSFSEVPPYVASRICQCGGSCVYSSLPKSYDYFKFACTTCGKDQIQYWHLCSDCGIYFHKNPSTFAHPGWAWDNPKCWDCLEKDPNFVYTFPSMLPERARKNMCYAIQKGKIVPKGWVPKLTPEELSSFDLFGAAPF